MKNAKYTIPHLENASRAANDIASLCYSENEDGHLRPTSHFQELVKSMVTNGWKIDETVIASVIQDSAAEHIEAFAQDFGSFSTAFTFVQKNDDNEVEHKIIVTGEQCADWIRKNYKASNTAQADSGSRRSCAIVIANVIREQIGLSAVQAKIEVVSFENRLEALEEGAAGNVRQGLKSLTPADRAAWLRKYAEECKKRKVLVKQSRLRAIWGHGVGQQLYAVHCLDNEYPELQLLDKVVSKEYPLPHKEKARAWLQNEADDEPETLVKSIDAELSAGTSQKPQRANSRAITEAVKGTKVALVRYLLTAIEHNKVETAVAEIEANRDELNAVFNKRWTKKKLAEPSN